MNYPRKNNLLGKLKKNKPTQGTSGTEMLTGWLSVRYHLPSGVRINPDFSVSKSFPRWPCWPYM
ncbi:hypothetical protein [endosymbiont GvMRE of Glomus versiforme]|uniref:hypothetical protein n=1 Tax=endosymbiont GvMRE of Glomus versiforme TaxID=2039283 RepID=UPI000EE6A986|nr:hypothetical protein [endosymbiont GvMRE of Glomus versiforme]RHZ37247.1 hypothetical protein GvMRE_I1g99 [endosymbiont GvMRE of Glomus versiforme]